MTGTLTIKGSLPGMNEIIAAARSHPQVSAKQKRIHTQAIQYIIKEARNTGFPRDYFRSPVFLAIDWFEKDKRRDPDNIAAATKFILDALVREQVLYDDSAKDIRSIFHRFQTDAENPRIKVELTECNVRE